MSNKGRTFVKTKSTKFNLQKKLWHVKDKWPVRATLLLGCVVLRWSASTSYKRPSACQIDVHQGCIPVGQHGAIIPGSAPVVLALPPLSPPSFPLHHFSLHAVVFHFSSPGGRCLDHAAWPGCQGRNPGRGSGATGEAWAQSTPFHPASPFSSPGCQLYQPPMPSRPIKPYLCAMQPGDQGDRRVIVDQGGWGPMWTCSPSETLSGFESPSSQRLITSLTFINSWGFFMPCRPKTDRTKGRYGNRGGEKDATPHNNNNNNNMSGSRDNTTAQAAGALCRKKQLSNGWLPTGLPSRTSSTEGR